MEIYRVKSPELTLQVDHMTGGAYGLPGIGSGVVKGRNLEQIGYVFTVFNSDDRTLHTPVC